jgi:hypothetical protein
LTPDWLVEQEILPKGDARVQFDLSSPGPKFSLGDVYWQPTSDRLDVQVTSAQANPGEIVAQILARLPHTPVRAIGNNFSFDLSGKRARALSSAARSNLTAHFAGKLLGLETQLILAAPRHAVLNLTLVDRDKSAVIRFNYHRAASSTKAAATAARHWEADRKEALKTFDQMITLTGKGSNEHAGDQA